MVLLRWLLQIFSLDSAGKRISRSQKQCYIFKSALSAVLIGTLDFYSLFWKIQHVFSVLDLSVNFMDVIQMVFDFGQYCVDISFIFKYGCEVGHEYFNNYRYIDNVLGIHHHEEINKRVIKLSSVMVFFWLAATLLDFTVWFIGYGIILPMIYSIAYLFLLLKVLTSLDLTVHIINIEFRLEYIGDLLQDCYRFTELLPATESMEENNDNLSNSITNKYWFYNSGHQRDGERWIRCEIKWLTRCYLLINEQCIFINYIFGVRILLNSLSILIDMVKLLNGFVRISIGTLKTHHDDYFCYLPPASMFLRFLVCVAILMSLVYHCERAYTQTTRIINITDHILINRNPDEALRSSLRELRALVVSRPINFNMANYFKLSYPFFTSMMSVVVTYTIILLQSL